MVSPRGRAPTCSGIGATAPVLENDDLRDALPMGLKRKIRDLTGIVREMLGMRWTLMLQVGRAAPAFDVEDHTGTRRTLDEYRGKKVLLWFYPKADTPG
jgi:hypothetical protein